MGWSSLFMGLPAWADRMTILRQMLPAPNQFQHAPNLVLKIIKMPFQNDENNLKKEECK